MTYGSCRFLFHQFIQRDKAHEIIADTDALATLSAALVRSPDINRLDQIMGCICGQFVQIRILMNLLDKQFQILILLFLYFDLLPQCLNVQFQGLLLFLVATAHDGKALVAQLSGSDSFFASRLIANAIFFAVQFGFGQSKEGSRRRSTAMLLFNFVLFPPQSMLMIRAFHDPLDLKLIYDDIRVCFCIRIAGMKNVLFFFGSKPSFFKLFFPSNSAITRSPSLAVCCRFTKT